MKSLISLSIAAAAFIAVHPLAFGAEFPIMAWGLKPTGGAETYVNELRYACHAEPSVCVNRHQPDPKINLVAIAFAQPEKLQENIEKAEAFSKLSESNREFREIGIDDFYTFMRKIKSDEKPAYLEKLISAAKSKNSNLEFGITVYEDELDKIANNETLFPKETLRKIDRVALYLHYRKNGEKLLDYTRKAKKLFPKAKIYGGAYHYDRRDYIRCSQTAPGKCSQEEEERLYAQTLQLQISLLKNKELSGIEFYPGFFGNEASWPAWQGRACDQNRLSECVKSSQKMTVDTLGRLRN